MHRRHRRGTGRCAPGFRGRRFPSSEELLRELEEYQRDLEQEVADVADVIRRLQDKPAEAATATA